MPNVEEILQGARDAMTVGRVYGDAIEQEGVTVIPAAVVGGLAVGAPLQGAAIGAVVGGAAGAISSPDQINLGKPVWRN